MQHLHQHPLSPQEMAALCGGGLNINVSPAIAVSPSIAVDTSIATALQNNAGASVAVGLLGGSASSAVSQFSQLGLVSIAL